MSITFSAMRLDTDGLHLIDQRTLPHTEQWHCYQNLEDIAVAIEQMVVRGAPAIGCAAAFACVVEGRRHPELTWQKYEPIFRAGVKRLAATRPTAVNLFYGLAIMEKATEAFTPSTEQKEICAVLEKAAKGLFERDLAICKEIGRHGLSLFAGKTGLTIQTHCNTGSLATAGYGTALGVIRSVFEAKQLKQVYVDETRPWLQGARLTAFELGADKIPHRLIADSAAGLLMSRGEIDAVIVGADRIARNGDTANKIGTYSLAVLAHYHKVPFYVAAPLWTFDPKLESGKSIPIEERTALELTQYQGIPLAPHGTQVFNPSFDVTPAELITGIITEVGVFKAPYGESIGKDILQSFYSSLDQR